VHGLRQVGPGGREALAVEMQRPAAVDDMVEDWQLALSCVRALPEVGQGPFAYFGLSMGAMFGIPLLAARDDVDVAVLGLLGTSGPAIRGLRGLERLRADAARIRCPLCFVMQLEDELFDRTGYLDLFDAFSSDDKRLHANPGLHPELPAEEVDFAFDFLRSRLEGTVKREILNPLAD
jgi:pimeloyl-ACP methyl ester carboxylesterase